MKWTRSLRLAALACASVAAFASVGCLKSDSKTTLVKDGSGSIEFSIVFDLVKSKELDDLRKALFPAPPPPPATPAMEGDPAMGEPAAPKDDGPGARFSKETIEKNLKKFDGLELKSHSREVKDGQDTTRMVIAFKSWETLCKSGGMGLTAVTLTKAEDGTYTIVLDPLAGQSPGDNAGGGGMGAALEGFLPMLESSMGGFEVKSSLTLPGTIGETNGTKSEDGTTVSWTMAWKDIVKAVAEKKKDGTLMKVTFKGEGIDWKPFSYKPDVEKMSAEAGLGQK